MSDVNTYTGSTSVDGILTWFYVYSEEEVNQIVIETGTEGVDFDTATGIITLTLTDAQDYTDADVQAVLDDDVDIENATVTGQNYEKDASDWVSTIYMIIWVQALWGQGTQLYRKGEDDEWSRIVKVQNISGPSFEMDMADVTDMDSPGGWEEAIPTILRSGELDMEVAYVPGFSEHDELINDMQNKVIREFKLVCPDEDLTTWSFNGYVTGWDIDIPYDDTIDASATIKPTGAPNLDAVAPQHEGEGE